MRTLFNVVVGVLALVALLERIQSAPVFKRSSEGEQETKDRGKALAFMINFGYLKKKTSTNSSGGEYFDTPAVKNAIKDVQIFGNLTATGELNQETLDLISTKRCGTKDPVKKLGTTHDVFGNLRIGKYYLQGTYWRKKDLTYRFKEPTGDLGRNQQKNILRKAFRLWVEASTLNIREAHPAVSDDNVDILIRFVRGSHGDPYRFDGQGGTLAHAFYPHNNKGLSGDAHFDDDEPFTTGTRNGINLDWVAVHEFGHSLGLEHSNVRESIMYPWYTGYVPNIELTSDDIKGIQALYGPKPTVRRLTPPKVKTTVKTTTTRRPRVTTRYTRRPRVTTRSTQRPRVSTPSTIRPRVTSPPVPTLCDTSVRYDTVFVGPDKWTYFFVGDRFWMINKRLRRDGPWRIKSLWREIETPVDAAYLNKRRHLVFFKGSKFWEYDSRRKLLKSGPITQYGNGGLPAALANMSAVFTWEGNGRTYFFKGNQYWKYNEQTQRAYTFRYPRDVQRAWKFPGNIYAAVRWLNGRNYVFWDTTYSKMDKGKVGRARGYPQLISNRWMKCNAKGRDLISEP